MPNVLLTRLLEWPLFCAIQAQNEGRGNRSGAATCYVYFNRVQYYVHVQYKGILP